MFKTLKYKPLVCHHFIVINIINFIVIMLFIFLVFATVNEMKTFLYFNAANLIGFQLFNINILIKL